MKIFPLNGIKECLKVLFAASTSVCFEIVLAIIISLRSSVESQKFSRSKINT